PGNQSGTISAGREADRRDRRRTPSLLHARRASPANIFAGDEETRSGELREPCTERIALQSVPVMLCRKLLEVLVQRTERSARERKIDCKRRQRFRNVSARIDDLQIFSRRVGDDIAAAPELC